MRVRDVVRSGESRAPPADAGRHVHSRPGARATRVHNVDGFGRAWETFDPDVLDQPAPNCAEASVTLPLTLTPAATGRHFGRLDHVVTRLYTTDAERSTTTLFSMHLGLRPSERGDERQRRLRRCLRDFIVVCDRQKTRRVTRAGVRWTRTDALDSGSSAQVRERAEITSRLSRPRL